MVVVLEKLQILLQNSQSKYYHFPVACILECKDGTSFSGVNVETSSPGAGICAERNALFQAISYGKRKEDFYKLHLYAESKETIFPCFICRQALIDYCNKDLEILIYHVDGNVEHYFLDELCPHSFSEESLG